MSTWYINYRYDSASGNETIDEFDNRKEAYEMLREYQLSYGGHGRTWVSTRACKNWRQEREDQMKLKRGQMEDAELAYYRSANCKV